MEDEQQGPEDTSDLYEQIKARTLKVMKVTLGALIEYFKGPAFAHLTEEQKDQAFDMVVRTWAGIIPEPAGSLWDELVIMVAYDAHTQNLMAEKKLDELYSQLGWGDEPKLDTDLPDPSMN
jgi:hypothetical protein